MSPLPPNDNSEQSGVAWAANGLPLALAEELRRVAKSLGPEEMPGAITLGSLQVLRCHFLVADHFTQLGKGLSQVGLHSAHLLQSAVARQHAGFGALRKWNGVFETAATLFFGLAKNHAFFDANKRTALLACLYQLQCNRRLPDADQREFEDLAERVAADELSKYARFRKVAKNDDAEVLFIAGFLRSTTRREDKREYRVSYRQLDLALRRFGYSLADAHDNKIHVYRTVTRKVGFLGRREETSRVPVTQIGFRDWGTEVSLKDIRHVRESAGLGVSRGIDSQMFFQGVDPIESLVAQYSDLLRRLSRK